MYLYGIRNASLNMDWKEAFFAAGELGFDGVEIVLREEEKLDWLLSDNGQTEIKQWVQDSGVQACSISFAMFREYKGNQDDQAVRDRVVGLVERALRACKGMGGAGILLPFFDRERLDISEREAEILIEDMKRCAPLAEELDMKVGLETSFSPGLLNRICDAVGSKMIGVYLDMGNAIQYGHGDVAMFRETAKHTQLIHLKDTNRNDLGEGDVDFPAVRDVIVEMGYEGWLTFETPAGDDPLASARKNLDYAKALFEG